MSNYDLEIVSKLPEFSNKVLKKYNIEGIETVGVWGNEPFEIRFRNRSFETVQVKISIDGTDILTGDVANTQVTKDMWVVKGYDTLTLKAWPETHNGGAQFVFTHAGNAVATHTHGNVSSLGIVAVAVFREGHKEPVRFVENHHHHHHVDYNWWYPTYDWYGTLISNTPTYGSSSNTYGSSSNNVFSADPIRSLSDFSCSVNSVSNNLSAEMDSYVLTEAVAPGVGAGEHVDQKITYVQGLKEPFFSESLRVKYLWWDDLVVKLKDTKTSVAHASGFPGDKENLINIGTTPRMLSNKKKEYISQQTFTRF